MADYRVGSSGEHSAVRMTGGNSASPPAGGLAFSACALVLMAAAAWGGGASLRPRSGQAENAPPHRRASEARTIKPSRALLRDDTFCLGCHAPDSLAQGAKPVDSAVIYRSAHGDLVCFDCHRDVTDVPHSRPPAAVNCAICHTEGGLAGPAAGRRAPGRGDLHTLALPGRGQRAPTCTNCHGLQMPHPDTWLSDHGKEAASSPSSCVRCHRQGHNDCGSCHAALAPSSHQASDWKGQHGIAGAGQMDLCLLCHGQDACNTCHATRASQRSGLAASQSSKRKVGG